MKFIFSLMGLVVFVNAVSLKNKAHAQSKTMSSTELLMGKALIGILSKSFAHPAFHDAPEPQHGFTDPKDSFFIIPDPTHRLIDGDAQSLWGTPVLLQETIADPKPKVLLSVGADDAGFLDAGEGEFLEEDSDLHQDPMKSRMENMDPEANLAGFLPKIKESSPNKV